MIWFLVRMSIIMLGGYCGLLYIAAAADVCVLCTSCSCDRVVFFNKFFLV